MAKGNIDLQAQTAGEKWFERAVNYAPGLWSSISFMIFGVIFTVLSFIFPSENQRLLSHMGPFWMILGLVFFERHHARKAFERLIEKKVILSGADEISAEKDAKQDGESDS